MNDLDLYPIFSSASQRVANSYLRAQANLAIILPAGADAQERRSMEAAQRDLHAFFKTMYVRLFEAPADFGLPLDPDRFLEGDEQNTTQLKAELNKKFQKPRDWIAFGLDFLMLVGNEGRPDGDGLALDRQVAADFLKAAKKKKSFIDGLQATCGLRISEDEGRVSLRSELFPAMMPALKALAEACRQNPDANLGKLNFARCDFGCLVDHNHPDALDLYQIFARPDYERVKRLHDSLTELGYKPIFHIYAHMGWEVQYQGKRKIKASPLVRIQYSERCRNPLQVDIKCASADRLIPLIYHQSERLRQDFLSRTNLCREDECRWCRNKKNLGPSLYDFDGEKRAVCWYTNPDIRVFDDLSVELIEEYALFHEQLAPA